MLTEVKRYLYNPDSSYNAILVDSEENPTCSPEEFERIQEEIKNAKPEEFEKIWNLYHTPEWNYENSKKWAEEHSVNHFF